MDSNNNNSYHNHHLLNSVNLPLTPDESNSIISTDHINNASPLSSSSSSNSNNSKLNRITDQQHNNQSKWKNI